MGLMGDVGIFILSNINWFCFSYKIISHHTHVLMFQVMAMIKTSLGNHQSPLKT